jgi:D-alanyl-D-alanine carboxypeptidase
MMMGTKERAQKRIDSTFREMMNSDSNLHNGYLLLHSDKLNIHWNMACGQTGERSAGPEQPYHAASIGKTFTAVIIAMFVEEGKLSYADLISKHLPESVLTNLHLYKGRNYSGEIRIEHLISNTSGLPDYYEDKTKHGRFIEVLLHDPNRMWTPSDTIEWSKQYLKSRFAPGKGLRYTNTGFNLLGLIIEKIASKPYHEVLHEYIFDRLSMKNSYLSQFSQPAEKCDLPIAHVNCLGKEINIEDYRSFSSNYAAGQMVSTSEDLLRFMMALTANRLISEQSLQQMIKWRKMRMGMDYGYGLMRVRIVAFMPKYNVWGHLGSTGSFMLYNPALDLHVIGSFNKVGYSGPSIRFIYKVLKELSGIEPAQRYE